MKTMMGADIMLDESSEYLPGQGSNASNYKKPMGKKPPAYEVSFFHVYESFWWAVRHDGEIKKPQELLKHISVAARNIRNRAGKERFRQFCEPLWLKYLNWLQAMKQYYKVTTPTRLRKITFQQLEFVFLDVLSPWADEYQITDNFYIDRQEKAPPPHLEIDAEMIDWRFLYQDGAVVLVFGSPRGGKTNSASYICRKVAGATLKNGAQAQILSNVAFYETTLENYPHIRYSVRTSEMLRMIAEGKIDHGSKVKYLWVWDEADDVINAQNRLGSIVGSIGVLFKQMGKFGVTAYLIFKNPRDADPRHRDKANMPGGTVAYKLHMGAYPGYNHQTEKHDKVVYFKKREEMQHHMMVEDGSGFFNPPIRNIPCEDDHYQHDMMTTTIIDTNLKKFAELCMESRPARSNKPRVLQEWHRDQGHYILSILNECRVTKEELEVITEEQILHYLNRYYKDRIKKNLGTWETVSHDIFYHYKVKMSAEECEKRWRLWRTKRQGYRESTSEESLDEDYLPANTSEEEGYPW